MASRLERGSLVVVFGGSGFIGRHAVQALAHQGWRVRAAVRRPESVRRAVAGAEAVVNLVGILAKAGPQTFEAVHVAGARAVANAAREAGAAALVHVSALGAGANAKSRYARTKAAGEAAVL